METIQRAMGDFHIKLNDEQIAQIQQYIKLLVTWNEKINLTAINDPLEILYRHFCESIYAGVAVPVENGRLADVGSGGGFPGLALKIAQPSLQVLLIESNVKKATFLAEVVRELGLSDARVLVNRYEDISEDVAPVDWACARAVGEFKAFLEWAENRAIAKNVVLWIGTRDLEEIRKFEAWEWREPLTVPQSLRRLILVGQRKILSP